MRTALRFGLLYWTALLLLLLLGSYNQNQRAQLEELQNRLEALEGEKAQLLKRLWDLEKPLRVLEWARKEGFIPMSEGRWAH